jgi:soluble lytic murein transglycosylase
LAGEEAYYRGLKTPGAEALSCFEEALRSSNPYIQRAAAEELILPLLRGTLEAGAFLERRSSERRRRGSPAYSPRPLIAAALYQLDRREEIPALHEPGPAESPEGSRTEGREVLPPGGSSPGGALESWDRALLLAARLGAGIGPPAGDTPTGNESPPEAGIGPPIGEAPAGNTSPPIPGEGAAPSEDLLAFLFGTPPGPALGWLAEELRRRPGLLGEARESALEGRLATARSAFQQGLALFAPALEEEPELFSRYPALINDLGRCFQFGSPDTAGLDLFLEWEGGSPPGPSRYRLLYYAGRIARARGLYARGAEIFGRALALAPGEDEEDVCIWYILDAGLRDEDRQLSGAELLELVKTWAPRWHDPPYFSDILDRISQRLASSGRWGLFPEFLALLEQEGDPLSRARYAYISGRALAAGLISGEEPERQDQIRRFLRAAYDGGVHALYYRAMAAYFLGEPFLPPEGEGRSGKDQSGEDRSGGNSHHPEMDFLLGFFREGVPAAAGRYLEALAGKLSVGELRTLAEALEQVGDYAGQIRLVSSYLVRGDYEFRRRDLELLSPRPFRELIEDRAREAGLAPELFYGLIRTESAFQPEIASRVGALGLTQLMPATAADMAGRIKRQGGPDYTENPDLGDPEINTRIGAYYLNYLQDLLDHPLLGILAYNGGLSRVRRWRRAQGALPGDLFLETVEYPETREYGRKVISAAALYGYLYYGLNPPPILADICQ